MSMQRVRRGADLAQNLAARERTDRPPVPAGTVSFRDRLSSAYITQFNERVDKTLVQIEELAERLTKSLTLADLRQYKQAIALLFRDLTSRMVQVKTEMEWDAQAWEHRTLVTIRKVDEELEQLTALIVNQEQDRLAILEKIGEIKGLLLDIRM